MNRQGIGNRKYFQDEYSHRDWRFYRSLLSMIVTNSEPGPILDIGAGLGYLVEAATRWGLDCQGLEGSQEAIDMAKKRVPDIRLTHHFLESPLPFSDDSFQTIIVNQVIEHLNETEAKNAVKEAYRLLKPKGMIFIFSPNRFNVRERTLDPTHQRLLTPPELFRLLANAGFENISPKDFPRHIFGNQWMGRALAHLLFYVTGWTRLSSSSNCMANKPPTNSFPI